MRKLSTFRRWPPISVGAILITLAGAVCAQAYHHSRFVCYAACSWQHGRYRSRSPHRIGQGAWQSIVVENKAGAGGTIAMAELARAAPDGYTMLRVARHAGVQPGLYAKPGYESTKDFAPIALLGGVPSDDLTRPNRQARQTTSWQSPRKPGYRLSRRAARAPATICRSVVRARGPAPSWFTFRIKAHRRAYSP